MTTTTESEKAARLALERAESGIIEAGERGQWFSAYAGPDGYLVQFYASGVFDIDGDGGNAMPIPDDMIDRVLAVMQEVA